jgi:hypothetical protein
MKRMKNEKPDELDDNQSIFAIARLHRNRTISKTTHFADISFSVDEFVGTVSQGRRSLPVGADRQPWADGFESRWDYFGGVVGKLKLANISASEGVAGAAGKA